MFRFYILIIAFFSSYSIACAEVEIKKYFDSGYILKSEVIADLNGDESIDKVVFLRNIERSKIIFLIVVGSDGVKCAPLLSTPEIEFDGCGGSCNIEELYVKNKSIYLQLNEKTMEYSRSSTYQFKNRGGDWMLIGLKTSKYFLSVDSETEEEVTDTNWITGDRNFIVKSSNGKSTKKTEKITVSPVFFKSFNFN